MLARAKKDHLSRHGNFLLVLREIKQTLVSQSTRITRGDGARSSGFIRIFVERDRRDSAAIHSARRPSNTCKRNKTDDVFRRGADRAAALFGARRIIIIINNNLIGADLKPAPHTEVGRCRAAREI